MKRLTTAWLCALTVSAWSCAAIAQQTQFLSSEELIAAYPANSIRSVDQADAALKDVVALRALVEKRFADAELACSEKFFATGCIDAAKERKRQDLSQLRAIEVEANAFKRRARAEQRQEAAAAKQQEANQRDAKPSSPSLSEDRQPAVAGANPVDQPPAVDAQTTEPSKRRDASSTETSRLHNEKDPRVARHQEKLKDIQERERADAPTREARVRAYDEKVRKAEARQQEVERRKKEREEKRQAAAPKPGLDPGK